MSTEILTMTAEQLFVLPDRGDRSELIAGELRRMSPAGYHHGRIAMNLAGPLDHFVRVHGLGTVVAAETGFLLRRNPDTVRAPDVAFVRRERLTADLTVSFFPGAPDLAVEVVSPSDTFADVEEKVFDWLGAGAAAVLVLNPRRCTVSVYRSRDDVRVLTEAETLDLSFVVPGFSVAIAALFA